MLKGMSLWMIINTGGAAMYILLLCSVFSLTVIVERLMYYRRQSRIKRGVFMADVRKALEKGLIARALEIISKADAPFARVAHAGIVLHDKGAAVISEAMEREITIETIALERFTSAVGTIGSVSVYIGLFGTVLGIIRAFRDISVTGAGGINVVIGGISEALVCTAAGLLVAIPAVVMYNMFVRRIDSFVADMELVASELTELLTVKK
jgi:biopolymer transport protein ExbB